MGHKCRNSDDCKIRCRNYCKNKCHDLLDNLYMKKAPVYKKIKDQSTQTDKAINNDIINKNTDNYLGSLKVVDQDVIKDYTDEILDIIRSQNPTPVEEEQVVQSIEHKTNLIKNLGNSKIEILDKVPE